MATNLSASMASAYMIFPNPHKYPWWVLNIIDSFNSGKLIPCPFLLRSQAQVNLDIPIKIMKETQVRWPGRLWNMASPSNPTTRKYWNDMVVDMHTEVRRILGCSWEDVDTTWRCTASLQCGCPQLSQCCISGSLDLKGRPYSMACEVIWPEFRSLYSIGISKVTCVWESSRNGHRISCQNCSCLWYYSKHMRDICQSAAESCTPMSFFALRLVVINLSNRCKMQKWNINCVNVLYLQVTVANVNKKKIDSNVIDKFTAIFT